MKEAKGIFRYLFAGTLIGCCLALISIFAGARLFEADVTNVIREALPELALYAFIMSSTAGLFITAVFQFAVIVTKKINGER